jgi:hypothetical protein
MTGAWRKLIIMMSFIICRLLFTAHYYSNQINEDEIGGTCSMHGNDKKLKNIIGRKMWIEQTTRNTYAWQNNIKMYLEEIGCVWTGYI